MTNTKDDKALSEPVECFCEACGQKNICRMYLLQNGEAAFVCMECRTGKKT